jgi:hypothetical protein
LTDTVDRPVAPTFGRLYREHALLLWPRLDRPSLARTRGDPRLIARLVARRTSLSPEAVVAMLTRAVDMTSSADPRRPDMNGR